MRDMHCHILPGVDDGAKDLDMSLAMLDAAREAGVTSIVCTPHARDPYFDYGAMWSAFRELCHHASTPLSMGFEVAHKKLLELGIDEWAERLAIQDTGEFLLELDFGCSEADFRVYERTIFELQGRGLAVVIAHPERYRAIQKKPELAGRLVDLGCQLQASAGFVAGGLLDPASRCARKLLKRGLYSCVASDAHRPAHYDHLVQALREFPVGVP